MPRRVAEFGEGNEDASGNGVYCFIRDLIAEGKDARFVNKKGRYVVNWSRALTCYADYKSKKNPQFKSKNTSRRKASNGLRAALLNFYKKEGAKEYKDCKKVNDKDEVIERQFQMPPRVFESLFGSDVQLTDDSDEQETSSIASEADEKLQIPVTPNSSDTGFDEAMDICDDLFNMNADTSSHCVPGDCPTNDPLLDIKTEDDVDPSIITTPCQMFDISEEELDSALDEICSSSDNDIDLLGVVQDICPSSGSVKGGLQFVITLTEELSEDDNSGIAHFGGIGDVHLEKLNAFAFSGIIPQYQQPGPVPVTVSTPAGRWLGMTYFMYVDETLEVLKQLVDDHALQSLFFAMWSQKHGIGSDGNIAQNLGPFTIEDEGSLIQTKQAQSVKVLQLLVYTAAQTDAQQFIQMIFSTSAGKIIFNTYKDRTPLPEDVARANGHVDLAQYLQDVNIRLSKESSSDVQSNTIDWLELVKAVDEIQKQSSVTEDETDFKGGQSEDDDNQSDYFADAETSSCGSFELEVGWEDDGEGEDGEGTCTKDGGSKQEPSERLTSSLEDSSIEVPPEMGTQFGENLELTKGDESYEKPSIRLSKSSCLGWYEWLSKWRKGDDTTASQQGEVVGETQEMGSFTQRIGGRTQKIDDTDAEQQEANACPSEERTAKPKRTCTKDGGSKQEPSERLTSSLEDASIEVPPEMGTQFGENLEMTKGDESYEKPSIVLSKSSCLGWLEWLSKWRKGDDTTASQQGEVVGETQEMGSFTQRIGGRTQKIDDIDAEQQEANACPSQERTAKPKKHKGRGRSSRRAESLSKERCVVLIIALLTVLAGLKLGESQLLHWAVGNGYTGISKVLMKCGLCGVDAPNFLKETPLHVAAKNGFKDLADVLIQLGSNVNARSLQQKTPLHFAAWSGHQQIADVLIQHGSDVNARNKLGQTPLYLAAGKGHKHIAEVLIQHESDINAGDDFGQTPLHLAAWSGHGNIAEVLMQHGSNVNARNIIGKTPLHLAAANGHKQIAEVLIQHGSDINARNNLGQTPLHLAAEKGHKQIAEVLIKHGGDINDGTSFGQTPLHLAAENAQKQIAEVLLQHGSDVNARNIFGQTPLHLAAENGHKQIAEVLIQHRSDVNTRNFLGKTPFHLARENGHLQIAEVLIQHGSDISAGNSFGQMAGRLATRNGHQQFSEVLIQYGSDFKARDYFQPTALYYLVENRRRNITNISRQLGRDVNSRSKLGQMPLHLAAENGHKHIEEVLIQHGKDVNASNFFGKTPLHLATENGHKHIAEVLMQHGSNVNAGNNLGQTSPHLATENGHKHIVEVLMQHGSNVNAGNNLGQTPLHLAAENGHKHIAEVLIQHGSDVNAGNNRGQTPLHLAAENGHKHIAEVLIQHGSDVNARYIFGRTPLHLTTKNGLNTTCIQHAYNIQHGSQVMVRDDFHQTALHLAARYRHRNISEVLIQHGSDVNARNILGQTPLHLAAVNGHKHIADILIQHGSDLKARDYSQETALHYAANNGQTPLYLAAVKRHKYIEVDYHVHCFTSLLRVVERLSNIEGDCLTLLANPDGCQSTEYNAHRRKTSGYSNHQVSIPCSFMSMPNASLDIYLCIFSTNNSAKPSSTSGYSNHQVSIPCSDLSMSNGSLDNCLFVLSTTNRETEPKWFGFKLQGSVPVDIQSNANLNIVRSSSHPGCLNKLSELPAQELSDIKLGGLNKVLFPDAKEDKVLFTDQRSKKLTKKDTDLSSVPRAPSQVTNRSTDSKV